ncbi:MAG: pyruvate dehydrogenase (acetyl-transferring), homodimeric type [Cellvibrionales bacterium]|nr:pyruvate dehydrogenase (acetyl-transferring), homodimeric type [Cellvibrionales bacterium]
MQPDQDSLETQEWLDALDSVIREAGTERAADLLTELEKRAHERGAGYRSAVVTPYRNSIRVEEEQPLPGDLFMERRIRSIIRWNALAMVMRCNQRDSSLGGHISSFASSATLYEIGFNHFWRGPDAANKGDLIFYQGHSSPGIYARSYLEGRISEAQLENFRREVDGGGLSSYPHPWLMPDYWQFPTVSMGLGPIQAIYLAHVMKYQQKRGLVDHADRKVWAFLGDGETDEPESLGAISLAGREGLDNLIFVISCNLQRLDGPVRGNAKIIQELEGVFRGAGWNVIKVVWGRKWDPLFARDHDGRLQRALDEWVDGEYQNFKAKPGDYLRTAFESKGIGDLVAHLSDTDLEALNRGGHDPFKVYAAYHQAVHSRGKPTVILAKTVKGYAMGEQGQAANTTHSLKKLDLDNLKIFRDRFGIPIADEDLPQVPYYRPPEDSPEMKYLHQRRKDLGGYMPKRQAKSTPLEVPALTAFAKQLESTGEREISSTMAFVRLLSTLAKDKQIGERIVPIVADEARTFGMEGMFRQLGIYSVLGQKYQPEDSDQIMFYKESETGQILEEGINEAGAMSAWLAAATSYSHSDYPMIPFYIFYSMFGFQRVGDLAWAAGDLQAHGFLIGATAGRTTLNGEGLQHQDGHSHLLASTIPNCKSYDPTYAYELAVIIQDGIRRMHAEGENCFYYITAMNENYPHPALPDGPPGPQGESIAEQIVKGLYRLHQTQTQSATAPRVQLLGSGSILLEVQAAARLLAADWNVAADVWSMTSPNELYRQAKSIERWNGLHPLDPPRTPWITQQLTQPQSAANTNAPGPFIIATDYLQAQGEMLRPFIPGPLRVLGTDGFGRSDTRAKLRSHFEVDARHIALAALTSLAAADQIDKKHPAEALTKYQIDPDKADPLRL